MCYDVTTESMLPMESFVCKGAFSPDCDSYVNNNPLVAPPLTRSSSWHLSVRLGFS